MGFDLASLFSPATAAQPTALTPPAQNKTSDAQPATGKDGWDAYLANPATRAALLTFGLNQLAGGWGSPVQQIAQSAGAGLEAGATVGSNEVSAQAEAAKIARQNAREAGDREDKSLDRQNKLDVAGLYNQNRLDVAGVRSKGGLNNDLYNKKQTLAIRTLQSNFEFAAKDPEEQAQAIQDLTQRLYDADPMSRVGPEGGNGGNLASGGGQGALPGTMPPGNSPGVGGSQTNGPVSSSPRPTATLKDGTKVQLSPDGKSWVPIR